MSGNESESSSSRTTTFDQFDTGTIWSVPLAASNQYNVSPKNVKLAGFFKVLLVKTTYKFFLLSKKLDNPAEALTE